MTTQENELLERAEAFATVAHAGQVRKAGGQAYITHPVGVADILKQFGFADSMVAAGYLHDVVEDTSTSVEELQTLFGADIATIVAAVTHKIREHDTWRSIRERYLDQVLNGPEGAWPVAVADKIHNIRSLIEAYNAEGPAVLQAFRWNWDDKLWFETTLLNSLRARLHHPLLDEYQTAIEQLQQLRPR